MSKGKLIVFGGPSGVGKSTIMKAILANPNLNTAEILNATTREPRQGEVQGKDKDFISIEEMERKIANDEMIEFIKFEGNGQYYGITKDEMTGKLNNFDYSIIDAEHHGLEIFKEKLTPEYRIISIFIKSPSKEILKKRLEERSHITGETATDIEKRLSMREEYLKFSKYYEFEVVNDELQTAINECVEIMKTK